MGWFKSKTSRRQGGRKPRNRRSVEKQPIDDAVVSYLTEFVQTRRGVEAYVEPATNSTQTTVLLIAHDGEWTRRRVPSPEWAHAFAEHLQLPGYDAAVVGYPQRMREYNRRTRKDSKVR